MPETTEDQVGRARERVNRLNKEIAEEKAKAAAQAVENVNDLRVAQLNAEGDRLQAELDALRKANSVEVQQAAVTTATTQAASGITASGATTAGDADGGSPPAATTPTSGK